MVIADRTALARNMAKELEPALRALRQRDAGSDGQRVVAAAKNSTLFGLVNCAGVAPAAKIVSKNERIHGPVPGCVSINLINGFSMMRLAPGLEQQHAKPPANAA